MVRNSVKVSDGTWRRLNAKKEPGDTFEDVIERLLDETSLPEPGENVAES